MGGIFFPVDVESAETEMRARGFAVRVWPVAINDGCHEQADAVEIGSEGTGGVFRVCREVAPGESALDACEALMAPYAGLTGRGPVEVNVQQAWQRAMGPLGREFPVTLSGAPAGITRPLDVCAAATQYLANHIAQPWIAELQRREPPGETMAALENTWDLSQWDSPKDYVGIWCDWLEEHGATVPRVIRAWAMGAVELPGYAMIERAVIDTMIRERATQPAIRHSGYHVSMEADSPTVEVSAVDHLTEAAGRIFSTAAAAEQMRQTMYTLTEETQSDQEPEAEAEAEAAKDAIIDATQETAAVLTGILDD